MLLHSLEIQNFRSLEHIKLDNLQGFNVLIGRNNAGKSSVFQALYDLIGVFLQGRNISLDVITDRDASRPFEVILTFKPSYQERGEFASLLVADVDEPRKAGMLDS
ncbi:MAG TPA: AAA family ATPase, partial [Methylomirabilota bacterium]|nr:AAA family ATPase [Methylomirabilota bacterium]